MSGKETTLTSIDSCSGEVKSARFVTILILILLLSFSQERSQFSDQNYFHSSLSRLFTLCLHLISFTFTCYLNFFLGNDSN